MQIDTLITLAHLVHNCVKMNQTNNRFPTALETEIMLTFVRKQKKNISYGTERQIYTI